jgi:predicted transcriptional regulator
VKEDKMWTANKIAKLLGVSHVTVTRVIRELFPEKNIKQGSATILTDDEFTKVILEIKHRGILNLDDKLVKNDKSLVKIDKLDRLDQQLQRLEKMTENMVVIAKELSFMLNKALSYSETLMLRNTGTQQQNKRKEIWDAVNDFKRANELEEMSRDILLDLAEKYQKEKGIIIKTNNDYESVIRNLILKNKVDDFVRWVRSRL